MKIAVTGCSGLIGTALAASFRADGHDVVRLVRRPARGGDEARWDPHAADAGLGATALDGVSAVVHLAGAGVADHRWSGAYKREIRASRVIGTGALASALARLDDPPKTLICASAIGWYGDTGGREVDESAPAATGFMPGVVRDWEAAAAPAKEAGIRVTHLRSGYVLARDAGLLGRLLPLFRLGLGVTLGPGTQVMSWISLTDEIGAIRYLLANQDVTGPVNLTAPQPVPNSEFTAALARALGRPYLPWLRAPAPVLRLGLGEVVSEFLSSAKVTPRRLLDAGYDFRYPGIAAALAAELAAS
jgi:uncharacterized protein (TIGR01777 family)